MIPFFKFKIEGHSMEPTILQGETVLVSKIPFLFSKPKINDIVAFKEKNTGKVFIKRIVKINPSTSSGEKYFVKGDNKKDSMDSKEIGWVLKKEIVGKVIYKISNS